MRLYHGSENIIEKPVYGKGARYNDYGKGFYCTENIELAKEWACAKQKNGYANIYDLDLSELNVLNLNSGSYNILNWLAILADNRTYWQNGSIAEPAKNYIKENFLPDISTYDVIIGYRADDSYFSFAQDFLNNAISLSVLSSEMRLGKLGKQIVLKSEKAFRNIQFQQAIPAEATIWLPQKRERDSRARRDYFASRKVPWKKGEIYMMQILEEEMEADDARLR